MNKKELGLGIGAIALGIATLVYFLNIPPKSAFYPRMISIAIILLGLVITFNAVKAIKAAPVQPEQPAAKAQISYSSVGLIVAYLFVYYFAFQFIGYTIPTFLMIIATSVTLGYKKWKILLPTAVLVSIGLYVAFTQVFNVRFPGVFF